jgi:primosomal replication protein N
MLEPRSSDAEAQQHQQVLQLRGSDAEAQQHQQVLMMLEATWKRC